jgi:hypothetical protein
VIGVTGVIYGFNRGSYQCWLVLEVRSMNGCSNALYAVQQVICLLSLDVQKKREGWFAAVGLVDEYFVCAVCTGVHDTYLWRFDCTMLPWRSALAPPVQGCLGLDSAVQCSVVKPFADAILRCYASATGLTQ